jgi:hypothetical protein
VSRLAGVPLAQALLEYTNFYIRFGLGRDFDADHPGWRAFVRGLLEAGDVGAWTHRFYLDRPAGAGVPPVVATFGCFAYERRDGGRLRLHFQNAELEERSPLSVGRQGERRAELAALFAHVRRAEQPLTVVGASWLYNVEAYRRLFPETYLATARQMPRAFQHMTLWGQFVNRRGDLRPAMAEEFRRRLARQSTLDGLERCFLLPVLRLEAPVGDFYDWYGVGRDG